ncbi:DsrE family protein [Methylobacterium sp. NEAU 140]|uniref:DsrE family protein n=1 Tax=Methylobacterium sp. NEAU 140 TaxID=3064945 RepID=UPI0027327DFD|nr:DsrE family protein [Methylobacterium sp. NEAU 140]MDP4024672.1 DsrE family protein [Methylobacterium sp. NEAU 140]
MVLSRRGVSGIAALMAGLAIDRAAAASPKTHRVAMQVSSNDAGVFELALNNAVNLAREYGDLAEELAVEIVAYGPGLHMVRADTSPVKARIRSVTESVPEIVLSACGNTVKAMEQAEGRELELLPRVGVVRAGAVRLVTLQEAGWSYLRV